MDIKQALNMELELMRERIAKNNIPVNDDPPFGE